jgi:hypothetical protein
LVVADGVELAHQEKALALLRAVAVVEDGIHLLQYE